MITIQNLYPFVALSQTAGTAGSTLTSSLIDTKYYNYAVIEVFSTTADVVSDSPSVFKLQEADVTNASSFVDITQFVGGGTGGFTIPNAATATSNSVYAIFNVDTRRRKRYLRTIISPRTTQTYSVLALLGRADFEPVGDNGTPSAQNASVVVTW